MNDQQYDLIIAGAGLAGMTLAKKLIARSYSGRVLILDKRADFSREQRWCTWGPVKSDLDQLVSHRWGSWQTFSAEGKQIACSTPTTAYTEFRAQDYFSAITDSMAAHGNYSLKLNTPVCEITENNACVLVSTDIEVLRADIVVDCRTDDILSIPDQSSDPWLIQSFVGWTVRTDVPVFDPDCATLMDFRVPSESQTYGEFFYVLPYSDRKALVECTVVGPQVLPLETYKDHLRWYFDSRNIGEFTVLSEEIGAIPMTSQPVPTTYRKRIYRLGTLAGSVKPSTGYGFARIQEQAESLANKIVDDDASIADQSHPIDRRHLIDSIFLDVLAESPNRLEQLMTRMFRKVSPEVTVKFLSERTSFIDDLHVMGVVGDLGFAKPAAGRIRRTFRP